MKSGPEREAIITRLQPSGQWWRWYNDGYAADAIIVHLNKMATLSSIGLYGTKTVREISVQIDIFYDQCQNIFTKDTAFLCTGSADPIQVPVYVPMLAGKDYTVCAVINSGQEQTYYGDKGSARSMSESNTLSRNAGRKNERFEMHGRFRSRSPIQRMRSPSSASSSIGSTISSSSTRLSPIRFDSESVVEDSWRRRFKDKRKGRDDHPKFPYK